MAPNTRLEADRGDTNLFDLDLNIPIDGTNDKFWFTVKRRVADLDTEVVIQKGFNVSSLSGISITDEATGKLQVRLEAADLASVEDLALIYDCQMEDASQNNALFTIQQGVIVLCGQVTRATA